MSGAAGGGQMPVSLLQDGDVAILAREAEVAAAARNFAGQYVGADIARDGHVGVGVDASEGRFRGHIVAYSGRDSSLDGSEGGVQGNGLALLAGPGFRRHGAVLILNRDGAGGAGDGDSSKRRLGVDFSADIGEPDRAVAGCHPGSALDAAHVHRAERGFHGRGLSHGIAGHLRIRRAHGEGFCDAREIHLGEGGVELGRTIHTGGAHLSVLVLHDDVALRGADDDRSKGIGNGQDARDVQDLDVPVVAVDGDTAAGVERAPWQSGC